MSSWFDSLAYDSEQRAANFQRFPCLSLCKDVQRLTHPIC